MSNKRLILVRQGVSVVLLAAVVVLGGWHVTRFAQHSSAALAQRSPLDGQEGTLLHEARLLLRGEALYQPLQPDRFVGAPYPPLHTLVLAATEAAVNPSGAPRDILAAPVFQPGRVVSLAATVATAVMLALAVWTVGRSVPVALGAFGLWLAFPPVQLWATRIKPDPLAVLFTTLGLLTVCWAVRQQRRWLWAMAAVLFALAFFTKQTAVAGPLATVLALLLTTEHHGSATPSLWPTLRQRFAARPLWCFVATYVGVVAVAWVALDRATAGQFTFHVWGLHPPGWWAWGRFQSYAGLLVPAWPLVMVLLLGVGLQLRRVHRTALLRPLDWRVVFPLCYALLGVGTLVGAGTVGAHHNHLLEPYLALVFGGGSMTALMFRSPRAIHAVGTIAVGGLLVAQLVVLQQRPAWYGGEFDIGSYDREQFVRLIQSQPGEVLADDVGLLVAAGRVPRYDDPATMGPAIRSGIWGQQQLLDEVAAQQFVLILMPYDATKTTSDATSRWTPEFVAALDQHYQLLYRDVMFSYVPRGE